MAIVAIFLINISFKYKIYIKSVAKSRTIKYNLYVVVRWFFVFVDLSTKPYFNY